MLPSDKKRIESEWNALMGQLWDATMTSSSRPVSINVYTDNIDTLMLHPDVAYLTGPASHITPPATPINILSINSGLGPTSINLKRDQSNSSLVSSLTGNTETLTAGKVQKYSLVLKVCIIEYIQRILIIHIKNSTSKRL